MMLKNIINISLRELGLLRSNPIYLFCMVIFPILVVVFFTSIMEKGQPADMPIGIVDLDNTATTRSMIRRLDAFQTTKVKARYANINEAREAIQNNEIYAFLYFPKNTTADLIASRQPKISFYYSNACITSGSLIFKELKTISLLGSAAVASAKLSALGKTEREITTFLQPVNVDLHAIGNPTTNYSVYLSTSLIPACITLFIFLITAYSIGTEQKFRRSGEWMAMAENNIFVALTGKLLPQFIVFSSIMCLYLIYIYVWLGFPHASSLAAALALAILTVLASQGFGMTMFGIVPSLRMSMSICSLWAAVSFSVMGSTFPVSAMSAPIQALANLFPMRHYFSIYQTCIFSNGSLATALPHILALTAFALLPLLFARRIKTAVTEWEYMP